MLKELTCVTQKESALFANSACKVAFLDVTLVQEGKDES